MLKKIKRNVYAYEISDKNIISFVQCYNRYELLIIYFITREKSLYVKTKEKNKKKYIFHHIESCSEHIWLCCQPYAFKDPRYSLAALNYFLIVGITNFTSCKANRVQNDTVFSFKQVMGAVE